MSLKPGSNSGLEVHDRFHEPTTSAGSDGAITRRELWALVGVLSLMHVVLMVIAGAAASQKTGVPFWDTFFQWDARRYAFIASHGYLKEGPGAENIVFYPLFPFLMRVTTLVTSVAEQYSGLIVNALLMPVMMIGVYRLAALELGRRAAIMALIVFETSPWSFPRMLGYTETLFIAGSVWGLFHFRQRNYHQAAILLLAAGLTRPTGITLLPLMMIEAWVRWRREKPSRAECWSMLTPIIAPALAYGGYLLINDVVMGHAFASADFMAKVWHKRIVAMPQGLQTGLVQPLLEFVPRSFSHIITDRPAETAAVIGLAFATIYAAARSHLSYAVFLAANLFVMTSTSWILSTPRYVAALFPIAFFVAPQLAGRRRLAAPLVLMGVVLQGYYLYLFCTGHWAF